MRKECRQVVQPILKKQQQEIHSETKKASAIFKEFSKAIDALDQRSNFLIGVLLNGFLLWDLQQSYKLEKWIRNYHQNVKSWFEVIEKMDAYNSLGNFAFNHPQFVFPNCFCNLVKPVCIYICKYIYLIIIFFCYE